MIRVVSFDIDDTLYDFQAASRHALDRVRRRVAGLCGIEDHAVTLEEIILDLESAANEMDSPYAHLDELRRRAFRRTLRRFGVDDEGKATALCRLYLRHRFDRVGLFEDAREVLSDLRRRYLLCAVSNGEQDLGQLGLAGLFTFVVFASDVGVDKPDPRIFRIAMERARCEPSQFVHVGDSLRSDVAGAKMAGARAVWFNRNPLPISPDPKPDAVITALKELPGVLSRLDRHGASSDTPT